MNKKGYTTIELLIVIGLFSIAYLVGTINVSHAFSYDENNTAYEAKINLIEHQAKEYAKANSETLFKDANTINIYANDLVKNNYFAGNGNGSILDPRDENKTLNDLKIEITKDGDNYTSVVK